MTDKDDLFEFGDFEDDESLELDLNDLFGDLEVLALDPDAAPPEVQLPSAAPAPEAPAPEPVAAAAPAAAPAPAATAAAAPAAPPAAATTAAAAPDPAPAATPIPVPVPDPATAAQPGAVPYVLVPQATPGRFSKATIAISAAAIVTLANVAVIAAPMFTKGAETGPTVTQAPVKIEAPEPDAALLARIDQLEAQLQNVNAPAEVIRSDAGERHRAFDEIDSNIEAGQYMAARERLYSLLAIVDRFPTHERDRVEDLASYLLADTYRLEAKREGTSEDRL